jgi:hypothetical protein
MNNIKLNWYFLIFNKMNMNIKILQLIDFLKM